MPRKIGLVAAPHSDLDVDVGDDLASVCACPRKHRSDEIDERLLMWSSWTCHLMHLAVEKFGMLEELVR